MPQEAEPSSWIRLLETRDQLIFQLRHEVPSAWPGLIGEFLRVVAALPGLLPRGVLLLLLADLARELDRLSARESTTNGRPLMLTAMDLRSASELPADALCSRFEQALTQWCARLEPEVLTAEVQALRVAEYIDRHFAEPITLGELAKLSGWCGRDLSRAFRASMRMSIREYLQATRIGYATERLRQGDKVESVLATVGWRGRKNFFRHFKDRIGTTPAQYRDNWLATSRHLEPARPSPSSPQAVRAPTSSNFQTV